MSRNRSAGHHQLQRSADIHHPGLLITGIDYHTRRLLIGRLAIHRHDILAWLATVVVSRMGPAPSQSILKAHAAVESEFERIGAR